MKIDNKNILEETLNSEKVQKILINLSNEEKSILEKAIKDLIENFNKNILEPLKTLE